MNSSQNKAIHAQDKNGNGSCSTCSNITSKDREEHRKYVDAFNKGSDYGTAKTFHDWHSSGKPRS